MSDNRVDTSRPEYSWIPFFEELAQRLHEDGWRHRQPEIVDELKRRREDDYGFNRWVNEMDTRIDPFSIFSLINIRMGWKKRSRLFEAYKEFYGIDAELPAEDPVVPVLFTNILYFPGNTDYTAAVETHWDTFNALMVSRNEGLDSYSPDKKAQIAKSRAVGTVGNRKLSMAMYWINPHHFLHIDTINSALRDIDVDVEALDENSSVESYFAALTRLRVNDKRPFPAINFEERVFADALKAARAEKSVLWRVLAADDHSWLDEFLSENYLGIHYDLNALDLSRSQSDTELRNQLDSADRNLSEDQFRQVLDFAVNVRRGHIVVMPTGEGTNLRYGVALSDRVDYVAGSTNDAPPTNRKQVYWRPLEIRGSRKVPARKSLVRVEVARQEIIDQIRAAERGEPQTDTPSVGVEVDSFPEGDSRVWIVHANRGMNAADFVRNGFVGTEWNELDLAGCASLNDIKEEYRDKHPSATPSVVGNQAGSLRRFLLDISPGDWVLTSNPPIDGTFYYGRILGSPTFEPVDEENSPTDGLPCRQRRRVNWYEDDVKHKSEIPGRPWLPTAVIELTGGQREAFFRLIGAEVAPTPDRTYSIDTMIDDGVFLDEDELARIMAQLERKQSLILQGPPGTGKTFLAKRLAYALMGERADERVASVQFHQSYAYEDFVGGYRPGVNEDDQLVFKPQDGAFLKLCERARAASPDDKFVMLIDEINRGNLSRVFGELLMLIEADKRSPEHAVELQHQMADAPVDDGRFFVPPNVYIIGTMNLADRSLTGMNVAMRRRFAFAELRPRFDTPKFERWLEETAKMPKWLRSWITQRMVELNDAITEDPSLDRQHAIGHSFFCPEESIETDAEWEAWFRDIVDYQIRPQLEEYWFDDPGKAEREVAALTNGMVSGGADASADEANS